MKQLVYILAACSLFAFGNVAAQHAQTEKLNFYVQGRMIDGRPFIKIVPANQGLWFYGMKNGYRVSLARFESGGYGPYDVIETDLRPAAEVDFSNPALPQKYAERMRKIIYEETFAPEGNSFDEMAAADKGMGQFYFTYLLMSAYNPELSKMSGLQMAMPNDLPDQFKIKVEVNGISNMQEQDMLKKMFYTDIVSPTFELKQGDKEITIQWKHSLYEKQFVAYLVERSSDGQNFEALGSPKIFNANSPSGKLGFIVVKDTLPKNYKDFWYRVRGYDAFGFLSKPGDTLKIHGKDMTPPQAPQRVQVEQITPKHIAISWIQLPAADLLGFQVIASPTETGTYQRLHRELLPPDQTHFNYTFQNEPYLYYRILAIDTARNAAASDLGYLVVYDTIPPSVPLNILATADTNNVVTLRWNRSPESDTKGYRISKAYHPSNGFIPITPIPLIDTVFTDTIPMNRLEKNVYYRVSSLDAHYNNSKPSAPVAAELIDRIPPTPPLLMKAAGGTSSGVVLEWNPSSSNDVESYEVKRFFPNDSTLTTIETLDAGKTTFSDKSLSGSNVEYAEYYISATDSSGNTSKLSNGKRILLMEYREKAAVEIQSAEPLNDNIVLKWNIQQVDNQSILVYRAEADSPFQLIDRVENASQYTDQKVHSGSVYTYKIGLLKSTGYRSPLSKEVRVKFK